MLTKNKKKMDTVLIYNEGDEYDELTKIKEFVSAGQMIEFINKNDIRFVSAYEFRKKLEIEPFEKVIKFKIK